MSQFFSIFQSNMVEIVTTIAMGIISFLGIKLKGLIEKMLIDETKRKTVKSVVNAVNKLYGDLTGDEKLIKAQENIEEILNEKGIVITELEMRMYIEENCSLRNNDGEGDGLFNI